MEGYGYQQMSCYRGGSTEQEFIGWNGLSGKQNFTHILNDILNVRLDDVLKKDVYFYKGKRGDPGEVKYKILLDPRGRCLVVKPPIDKIVAFKHLYLESIEATKYDRPEIPFTLNVFMMDQFATDLPQRCSNARGSYQGSFEIAKQQRQTLFFHDKSFCLLPCRRRPIV